MRRIFLSYRYTNVPKIVLEETVLKIVETLREFGNTVFCNLENDDKYFKERWTTKQIMDECFEELRNCDYHISFISSRIKNKIGEGIPIELGYAKCLGLKTLLLLPNGFHCLTLREVVDKVIIYNNMSELLNKLLPEIEELNNNEKQLKKTISFVTQNAMPNL